MKNSKTIYLVISLVMIFVFVQAKNDTVPEEQSVYLENINTAYGNPIFYEIMYKVTHDKCLQIEVSSMSIKKSANRSFMNSFTSYGSESLVKLDNHTLKTARSVNTEFSDRNNFAGAKTLEDIEIYEGTTGDAVGVKIKMVTWGNRSIVLNNVKIHRDGLGYFITGRVTDNNRTVYYTLGIFEVECLI